jgi:pimeloyl-ACP methyl ester carboxylesterase
LGAGLKKVVVLLIFFILSFIGMLFLTPDLNRIDLERAYAQAPSQFIDVKGLRVHYRDTGIKSGTPIVLLHGFGSSLHTWEEWSKELERNHRVIRMDLAGFGLTGADPYRNYSDTSDVQRLLDFVDLLGLNNFILVGHSMGGRIAWNFASQYPNRVGKLVLMAPDGFPVPGQRLGDKPYDVGRLADLIQFFLPKFLVKKSVQAAFFDPSLVTDELVNRYSDLLRAPTVRLAILDRMRQTVNSDPRDRLRRITASTLLLWGEGDQMIPSSNSLDYQETIGHSSVVVMSNAGHVLQEENPHRGLSHVLEFIEP